MKKDFSVIILVAILFLLGNNSHAFSQSITPSSTPIVTPTTASTNSADNSDQVKELQQKISEYQSKISDLHGQENTLSSAIKVVDNQVAVTQLRMATTQMQIQALGKDIAVTKRKIVGFEQNINSSTKAMLARISATYKAGQESPWMLFLTSNNISNFMVRLKYLKLMQIIDKKNVYAAEQSKVNYATEKAMLESKQVEATNLQDKLQGYTDDLSKQEETKKTLLSQTQGNEANYERLLASAKSQLAGFSNFVQSQGGASLLSGQTACDDWGCYYNQRDSQWGGNSLNGTQYTIASDGCLVTSVAMVYTHYGHRGVTPQSINSNSSNFASYYPAYLLYSVTADGASSSRTGTTIDSNLSSGTPVIVGVHAYGGTHFVVLVSGSGGNYIMNDPYVSGGHKINFTDHYSMGSIFEIDKLIF